MAVVEEADGTLLTVTARGFGKRSGVSEYRVQSRAGQGLINVKTTERNGEVVAVPFVRQGDELMVITAKGMILRIPVEDFPVRGRNTQGVQLIQLEAEDKVVAVAKLAEKHDESEPS